MTSTNERSEPNDPHRTTDRTGLLRVEGGVVVYELENPAGWIQSDEPVSLSDRR